MAKTRMLTAWLSGALLAASASVAARAQSVEASSAAPEEIEARLTRVEGAVYVHLQGHPEGEFAAAEVDTPLAEGDWVRTGTDGSAEVSLGGESVVELAANSDFIINSLAPAQAEFHLGIGSLVAKIRSLLQGQNMEFHTPTAVAAVRGTELGVAQDEDYEPARIGVFDEGHVAVTAAGSQKTVQLGPGQETEISDKAVAEPRPLKSFLGSHHRMDLARQRVPEVSKSWISRPKAEREGLRAKFLKRPTFGAEKLKGVREDRRRRAYKGLAKRREQIKQQLRTRPPRISPKRTGPKSQGTKPGRDRKSGAGPKQGQRRQNDGEARQRQEQRRQRREETRQRRDEGRQGGRKDKREGKEDNRGRRRGRAIENGREEPGGGPGPGRGPR